MDAPLRTVKRAKQLRQAMSLPEVLLWVALRKRTTGAKFRRQHPKGVYVLDFYCAEAGLAIEVDGDSHNQGDRPERDQIRNAWLEDPGVRVLRIPAKDVLVDVEAAVDQIIGALEPPQALRASSPRGGAS